MTSLLQQLLDPVDGFLPTHVLLDGQAFEYFDRGLRRALRLQIGLEDVDVVIEPFQVLLLDRGDALKDPALR